MTNSLRTHVYVDGFNLYHGCLERGEGRKYRWLNIKLLVEVILKKRFPQFQYDITALKYFTARVKNSPQDQHQTMKQNTYLRGLKTIPNVKVVLGQFLEHKVEMRLVEPLEVLITSPLHKGHTSKEIKKVQVLKREEKGSDVNLASEMIVDCYEKDFDVSVLISNDSDLVLPVKHSMSKGKTVIILNPHKKHAFQLKSYATAMKHIDVEDLRVSQFPDELFDEVGKITKPPRW